VKVLVVDDHTELLDLLRRSMGRDGHEVCCAADLTAARDQLRGFVPDVIVLDVGLPDGSGVEFCRQLRRAGHTWPVLLLTAHTVQCTSA